MGPVLLSGLVGGWLAADATALAQLLVSQPLVGGTLAGWVWGDPLTGLRVGALLQLYALSGLPLGGRTPDDYASAGVIGASVAVLLTRLPEVRDLAVPLVLGAISGLLAAVSGRPVVRWLRGRNQRLAGWVEAELAAGRAGALGTAHALGVLHAFALGAAFTLAGVAAFANAARWALEYDGVAVARAATLCEPLLWGVGAGLASRQMAAFGRGSGVLFLAVLAFWVALRWMGSR